MSGATRVLNRGQFLSHERDYNHATDKEYHNLRSLADQAYLKRKQLSHQSQVAFKQGDKQRAHELSVQAAQQEDIAEGYSRQAAEYVFVENNADSDSNEIDLHGLYVKELEYILKQRIVAGINRHESKLEVIVGKGLHSVNGVAKLKPAVEELCRESNLKCYVEKHNTGVLVVELANAKIPSSWSQPSNSYLAPVNPPNSYQQHQPQYQQTPQYQQGPQQGYNTGYQQQPHNNNNNNNNNDLISMAVKLLCFCIKNA